MTVLEHDRLLAQYSGLAFGLIDLMRPTAYQETLAKHAPILASKSDAVDSSKRRPDNPAFSEQQPDAAHASSQSANASDTDSGQNHRMGQGSPNAFGFPDLFDAIYTTRARNVVDAAAPPAPGEQTGGKGVPRRHSKMCPGAQDTTNSGARDRVEQNLCLSRWMAEGQLHSSIHIRCSSAG